MTPTKGGMSGYKAERICPRSNQKESQKIFK